MSWWQTLKSLTLSAGFTGTENVRVVGSGRLPPRFQKKAREARQSTVWEAVRVKLQVQWRCQEHRFSVEEGCRQ